MQRAPLAGARGVRWSRSTTHLGGPRTGPGLPVPTTSKADPHDRMGRFPRKPQAHGPCRAATPSNHHTSQLL